MPLTADCPSLVLPNLLEDQNTAPSWNVHFYEFCSEISVHKMFAQKYVLNIRDAYKMRILLADEFQSVDLIKFIYHLMVVKPLSGLHGILKLSIKSN